MGFGYMTKAPLPVEKTHLGFGCGRENPTSGSKNPTWAFVTKHKLHVAAHRRDTQRDRERERERERERDREREGQRGREGQRERERNQEHFHFFFFFFFFFIIFLK